MVSPEEFVIGNIAPDCGYGKKDSVGEFVPPPRITHWSPSGKKRDCRYKDFLDTYLKEADRNAPDYSFYLGYYVHLLTDIIWSCMIFKPTLKAYESEFNADRDFIHTVKRDWNDLDFKYLSLHPDLAPYHILDGVHEVKDYLPYYDKGQLTVQSRFVVDFYKNGFGAHNFNREFTYLTPAVIDNFILCATELIEKDLRNKNLVRFL